MPRLLEHFGWLVSPYSAKTRACLKFKHIPFVDREPTVFDFYRTINKAVGRLIMPTVRMPDGRWLQDSSDIIDEMERLYPDRSVTPPGTKQQLVSLLLELYGDEWLPMAALHFRWNTPANAKFALAEFSRSGLPMLPGFIGRRLVTSMAKKMQGYLPVLGVTESTQLGVETMAKGLISDLNTHFENHSFLLGERPCLGDFAIFGPLWAHLYRDPGSTYLFDHAPKVVEWMNTLLDPAQVEGEFISDDTIPDTLLPILRRVFDEQIPWIKTLVHHINQWCKDNPDSKRVRGAVGTAAFTVGGINGERKLATFVQWKAQRPIFYYQNLTKENRAQVDTLLERIEGHGALDIDIQYPFERRKFKAVISNRQPNAS